jgi:hypothetical protein
MPPTTSTAQVSQPKTVETATPQPQPAPRSKPFTIKLQTPVPA